MKIGTMKVGTRLSIGFGLVLTLMTALAATGLLALNNIGTLDNKIIDEDLVRAEAAHAMTVLLAAAYERDVIIQEEIIMNIRATFLILALAASNAALAQEFASPKEAEAMVAAAIAAIKENPEKTYESITAKDSRWVNRDLYPVVYDLNGKVLAHGQNPKMVGKDLIEMRDVDGKAFVRERVELALSKGKFWQDYKFSDPVSKKILPKQMYCERLDNSVVCAGVYKH